MAHAAGKVPTVTGARGGGDALERRLHQAPVVVIASRTGTDRGLDGAVGLTRGAELAGIAATFEYEGLMAPAIMMNPFTVRSANIEQTIVAGGLSTRQDVASASKPSAVPLVRSTSQDKPVRGSDG